MTSIAAFTGIKQYLTYVHYFVSTKTSVSTKDRRHRLQAYLNDSSILLVDHFRTIGAAVDNQADVVDIRFRLRESGAKNFVLLRGLFEFSRPKEINISSNTRDRSFELRLTEDQVPAVASYLQAIGERFQKEIAFKASLKKILRFEKAIKIEEAKLYQNLQASV